MTHATEMVVSDAAKRVVNNYRKTQNYPVHIDISPFYNQLIKLWADHVEPIVFRGNMSVHRLNNLFFHAN